MTLERFKQAQADPVAGFATALAELKRRRKTSHWIWYVFPQIAGLGRSPAAQKYALRDLEEARGYLRDPVLRGRLEAGIETVAEQLANGIELETLMGGRIDALKLVSSLTLFELAASEPASVRVREWARAVLEEAGRQGFPRCAFTLAEVRR